MDWISKFEQEDRQKQRAQQRALEREQNARSEEEARFGAAVSRLGPILKKQAAEVADRLNIRLRVSVSSREITVQAPIPHTTLFGSSPFPFSLTLSPDTDGQIRVSAKDDQCMPDRPFDQMPDNMTVGDYYGTTQTILETHASLDELLSGDLPRLLEWLVASSRSGSAAPAPHLAAEDRQKAEARKRERAKRRRSSSAVLCLIIAILTSPLGLPGPLVLIWGLYVRHALIKAGQTEGRRAAAWAIGLGVFDCVMIGYLFVLHLLPPHMLRP